MLRYEGPAGGVWIEDDRPRISRFNEVRGDVTAPRDGPR